MNNDILACSIKVDPAQPVFAGHFPGQPILPGVFLLQFMLQALQTKYGKPLHFSRLRRVKFLRPIVPGDEIRIECQNVGLAWHNCRVLAQDGIVLAQAEIELNSAADKTNN